MIAFSSYFCSTTMDPIQLLCDVVLHPSKYMWFVNVPGQCDASEFLYDNGILYGKNEISEKVKTAAIEHLMFTGRYYLLELKSGKRIALRK